ncbi:S-adenosyl-L-methionine-dependent methyltransferase [Jimgerdemannia flammicorona]|uniref:S-adenosyl-L-methionine-dependent methyltransferase n=1 Tax=Jimgerdemannia flammicorona TaxID=994334 RepID=A0A433Q4E1_9FUNG|nr:S-adenosyl-L-methionine-dependent methyltransferase [Jimgerdemannia flammicorona]
MGQKISTLHVKLDRRARRKTVPLGASKIPTMVANSCTPSPARKDEYKWIDRRGYREGGNPKYALPTDRAEAVRMNARHYQLRYIFQRDYQAPITEDLQNGINVLDVGCGTGIWSTEMASQYPASTFIGTDIVGLFKGTVAPSNCTFVLANTVKGLPFPDNTFDFVFQRASSMCFTVKEWPVVLKELVRVTKPGGIVELLDDAIWIHNSGPVTEAMCKNLDNVMAYRDIKFDLTTRLDPLLGAAGLKNVQHEYHSVPIGWGPTQEEFKDNIILFFQASVPVMRLALGISSTEMSQRIEVIARELNGVQKSFMNFDSYIGIKPAATESESENEVEAHTDYLPKDDATQQSVTLPSTGWRALRGMRGPAITNGLALVHRVFR